MERLTQKSTAYKVPAAEAAVQKEQKKEQQDGLKSRTLCIFPVLHSVVQCEWETGGKATVNLLGSSQITSTR